MIFFSICGNMFTQFSWFSFAGKLDEAVDHFTEAIILNPNSAILYAARGSYIVDCFSISYCLFRVPHPSWIFSMISYDVPFSANAFIKLKKPNAAICDAEAAFQVCP